MNKAALNPESLPGPTLEDFAEAQRALRGVVQETPIEISRYLSEVLGQPVHLKCENLQRTGAYKIRGAYYCISKLTDEEKARGVVAASAGNHAQGVAFAAREQGIKATIFTPMGVALPKLQATMAYGAEVILGGESINEPLKAAQEFAETTGAVRIPPFDHPDIIAGQGTVGLVIMDQVPEVTTVIVPIGGGGLMAGVASAMKQRARAEGISIKVIGVQAENASSYLPSLKAGKPVQIDVKSTINDGIAVQKPGVLNFEIIKDAVDDIVTVSDDETARAMLMLLERKVEATGPTVVLLSGGNIDPMIMERVISRGMAGAGRYMKMRIPLPDRPGQLARTSQIVSDNNANVVEVIHTRHGTGLQISQVELELHVETRGPEHAEEVLSALRAEGYEPRVVF